MSTTGDVDAQLPILASGVRMAIDIDSALHKVRILLSDPSGDEFVITQVMTKPYGWVFSYTTKKYIETGDPGDGLIGNSPFFVLKSGEVLNISTTSIELFLKNWEIENTGKSSIHLCQADEAPIVRVVNTVFVYAIRNGAKEIYLEPTEKGITVLYHTGEERRELMKIPFFLRSLVNLRLKSMAGIDSPIGGQATITQRGHFTVKTQDANYAVNLRAEPTKQGEQVLLTISPK